MTPPRIPVTAAVVTAALPPIRYSGERGLATAHQALRQVGYSLRTTDTDACWLVGCRGRAQGAVWYPHWRAAYDAVRTGKV